MGAMFYGATRHSEESRCLALTLCPSASERHGGDMFRSSLRKLLPMNLRHYWPLVVICHSLNISNS